MYEPADSSLPAPTEASAPITTEGPEAPACEFKGRSYPVLALVLNPAESTAFLPALEALLTEQADSFDWEPVVIDASRLPAQAALDLTEVVSRLRAARLHPVALIAGQPALREQATRLSLGWSAPLPERRTPPAKEVPAASATRTAPQKAEKAVTPEVNPALPKTVATRVIERPVRSGQQIYARDCDLVVIGDVSPGAEVIADGHVHVYGTLGGRAIAGARGRRDAVIFTQGLRAELVAVGGIYRTFEDGVPEPHAGQAVRISLDADADTLSLRPL